MRELILDNTFKSATWIDKINDTEVENQYLRQRGKKWVSQTRKNRKGKGKKKGREGEGKRRYTEGIRSEKRQESNQRGRWRSRPFHHQTRQRCSTSIQLSFTTSPVMVWKRVVFHSISQSPLMCWPHHLLWSYSVIKMYTGYNCPWA